LGAPTSKVTPKTSPHTTGNVSEKSIQNAILREFGTRPDMRLWRMNVAAAQFGGSFVRAGVVGQADLTGILPDGRRLEVEVKRPGGEQSAEQQAYQRMIIRFGGVYCLACSVADVYTQLLAAGYDLASTAPEDTLPAVPDDFADLGGTDGSGVAGGVTQ
jgi:hypothetical protein